MHPLPAPDRRHTAHQVCWLALALTLVASAAGAQEKGFGFDDVVARARALAATTQRLPDSGLSKELLDLDYDQYRDIRFRPDRSLWRDAK
ncbi:MAG: glucan biosynthesis protein, partial [Casimicrobiaceae bacterium]